MKVFRDADKIQQESYECLVGVVEELRGVVAVEFQKNATKHQYLTNNEMTKTNGNYEKVKTGEKKHGAFLKAAKALERATEILDRNSYGVQRKNTNPEGRNGRD